MGYQTDCNQQTRREILHEKYHYVSQQLDVLDK